MSLTGETTGAGGTTTTVTPAHNPERNRYELRHPPGVIGVALYRRRPGQVVFVHTEVDATYLHQGLATRLAEFALADVRASDLRIVALCPFISAYLRAHHDYDDILDSPGTHRPGTTEGAAR